ncbi:hypothetical protein ACMC56_04395 [Campylobacterota bacterium DY0563]
MSSNTKIINQLKAIVTFEYFYSYNVLENNIRSCFEESLESLSPERINQLHFLRGGLIGTYINYEPLGVKLNQNSFNNTTKFKELNINQILKVNKEKGIIEPLTKEIDSLQIKTNSFKIGDCVIKLMEMRNVLAHKIKDCNFSNKHNIEKLSDENINKLDYDFLEGYDLKLMDDMTKDILSNYVYMQKIIDYLELENIA